MQRVKIILMLIIITTLFISSNASACDLWGMTSSDATIGYAATQSSFSIFRNESIARHDTVGWGFLAWDSTFNPVSYRTDIDIGDVPITEFPVGDNNWNDYYGVHVPQIFIAHSRKSSTFTTDADPHPFVYKLNGRTIGVAHNGGINQSQFNTIRDTLIIDEYNNLDFLTRYYDSDGRELDSEIYVKYLMKNMLLADNYELGDDWAIETTINGMDITIPEGYYTPGYSSLNFLMSDGSKLIAVSKSASVSESTHRLWWQALGSNNLMVVSQDMSLEPYWEEIDNGYYMTANEGEDWVSATIEGLDPPSGIPVFCEYKISGDHITSGNSSIWTRTATNDNGDFAAVWYEEGSVKIRFLNPMGLGEQEEILITNNGTIHNNITAQPYGDNFYVVFKENGNLFMVEFEQEVYYDDNDNDNFIDLKRWVMGTPVNITNGLATNPQLPAIACDDRDMQIIVWQESNIIKGVRVSDSNVGTFTTFDDNSAAVRSYPDILYMKGSNDPYYFVVAWAHYEAGQDRGVKAQPLYATNDLDIVTDYHYSEMVASIPFYNPMLKRVNASFPRPVLGYLPDKLWFCSYANQTDDWEITLDSKVYEIDYSGTSIGDPYATSTSELFSTLRSYDAVGRDQRSYDQVFNAILNGNTNRHIYSRTVHRSGSVTTPTAQTDMYPNISGPSYPTVEINNWCGEKRRFISWSGTRSGYDGYHIFANFSPSHFRYMVYKQIGGYPNDDVQIPSTFELGKIYPNPFNPTTTIDFSLPNTENLKISIFNVNGQLVKTLIDGQINAGKHQVVFDGSGLSSGVYFVRMQAGDFVQSKKMILMK